MLSNIGYPNRVFHYKLALLRLPVGLEKKLMINTVYLSPTPPRNWEGPFCLAWKEMVVWKMSLLIFTRIMRTLQTYATIIRQNKWGKVHVVHMLFLLSSSCVAAADSYCVVLTSRELKTETVLYSLSQLVIYMQLAVGYLVASRMSAHIPFLRD